MRQEISVSVNAPVSRVWQVLTDVERWPEWTPSMTRLRRLDPGPLHVGSRVRVKQPRLPSATWRVTEGVAGREFTWVTSSVGVTTVASHHLSAATAAIAEATLRVEQFGPLAPLVRVCIGRLIRRHVQLEAEGLKARCETH